MAEIQPFAGIRYRAADLARVLAPPYDVIPPATRDELYARDPHNIVRVILNRTPGTPATRRPGRRTGAGWPRASAGRTRRRRVYVLEQSFADPATGRCGASACWPASAPRTRLGRVILPHEQHAGRRRRRTGGACSSPRRPTSVPIFLMFPDPGAAFATLVLEAIGHRPAARYTDDGGVGHRMWRVEEPGLVGRLQALLGGVKSYIADGHHRHATALRYRDAVGPDGAWTLGYFTPIEAPGLVVQPYHRILSEGPSLEEAAKRSPSGFRLTGQPDVAAAARAVAASPAPYAFALAEPGRGALVVEAEPGGERLLSPEAPGCLRALDTYFLHHAVLGPLLGVPDAAVSYVHSQAEAEEALAKGACRLALLMRATPVRQIVDVAEAGESMPAKSTFFHPKLPSGLVIHPLVA